jgi:hypothetical protein
MVISIPESAIIIIIIFVVNTTRPITTIRHTYFGIRVNTIKYISIWILTKFAERIRVIMQFFMDQFACSLGYNYRVMWMQTLWKIYYIIKKVLKLKVC